MLTLMATRPPIIEGYCQCGCGRQTRLATYTSKREGCVEGKPRRYVSGHNGRVPVLERIQKKIKFGDDNDCWEWQAAQTPDGYGVIGIGRGKLHYVHRLVFEATVRPLNEGELVLHSCDNPSCCNPKHLFAGTHLINMRDKEQKGRGNHATGERNGSYKHGRYAK